MSEERRLAYVALTRAKEKLYITYAKSRMMYGKTMLGALSCFIREETPEQYLQRDIPRQIPPRQSYGWQGQSRRQQGQGGRVGNFTEFDRRPDTMSQTVKGKGAQSFGITRFAPGTRVAHGTFGEGTVLSSRDMGGDVLYEVKFDTVGTKKLMATFARLRKL
jgi:DNA helicase-2/ATP-dependent DNA helicase PcrA